MSGKPYSPMPRPGLYLPEGELGKTAAGRLNMKDRQSFEEAAEAGVTMEAYCVLCDCASMQLTVPLPGGIRGVIPKEEAGYQPGGTVKDIAVITRVGKPVQFKVLSLRESDRGESVALLSRRLAQRECYEEYVSRLCPGDVIPARVTHLEPFGAFCDIGCGVISLLTVDRVSVSRISHPADRFRVGDGIYAAVSRIDEFGRVSLTHRELLGTWEENAAQFSAGQTVTGIIRSVEDYGVFVELTPNLAGLAEVCGSVTPGDACSVYIKSILPERMKIKLVLIDTCGPAKPAPCRYFIDPSATPRLDRWRYSPSVCRKLVETEFAQSCAVK